MGLHETKKSLHSNNKKCYLNRRGCLHNVRKSLPAIYLTRDNNQNIQGAQKTKLPKKS
jgi:hypothetical protein